VNDNWIDRIDFSIQNRNDETLQCSYFRMNEYNCNKTCVIYCHSNNGNRLECHSLINGLLSNNVELICFDFSGSG